MSKNRLEQSAWSAMVVVLCGMSIVGIFVSACSWFTRSAIRHTETAKVPPASTPTTRSMQFIPDLPPDYKVCGVSSRQGFIIAARHCPPREGDIVRYIRKAPGHPCEVYGDVFPLAYNMQGHVLWQGDSVVDYQDILAVVDELGSLTSDPHRSAPFDVWPCVKSNPELTLVDYEDLLAVMQAFQGNPICP